jgi:lysophospholipase L1-like esterase
MLERSGHQVNMVGQKKNGNFTDNDVEATPGFVIDQIASSAKKATPLFKPNLVLVDAGTNNCNKGGTVPDAGANVTALIDDIFSLSPGVTVVLATILQNKIATQDSCRVDINKQYQALAAKYEQAKARFVLVDMRSPDGPTTADLNDTRHPNDVGYQKMAVVWNQGISQALTKGFLSQPVKNGIALDGENPLNKEAASVKGSDGSLVSIPLLVPLLLAGVFGFMAFAV